MTTVAQRLRELERAARTRARTAEVDGYDVHLMLSDPEACSLASALTLAVSTGTRAEAEEADRRLAARMAVLNGTGVARPILTREADPAWRR